MNWWTHLLNVLYTLAPSDWINVGVSIGTLAMAVFTWRAVAASKESLRASVRSAVAAELNAERTKDALMPYLDLEISSFKSANPTNIAELRVTNSGTGPACIGLFSHREDLKHENALDPRVVRKGSDGSRIVKSRFKDTVVAAGETVTFSLEASSASYSEVTITSLSVFYEDVYGRKYRTRLLYTIQTGECWQYVRLGTERLAVTEQYPDPKNVMETHALEGNSHTLYNPSWEFLHRLDTLECVRGKFVSGIDFSKRRPLRILDVLFESSDYPSFKLMIEGFPEFVLDTWHSNNKRQYRILHKDSVNPNYALYGLNPSGNTHEDLAGLYLHILISGLGMDGTTAGILVR